MWNSAYVTVSISNTLRLCWVSLWWVSHFIFCYAKCHYAKCCILFTIILNAVGWVLHFIYYYAECRYAECRSAFVYRLWKNAAWFTNFYNRHLLSFFDWNIWCGAATFGIMTLAIMTLSVVGFNVILSITMRAPSAGMLNVTLLSYIFNVLLSVVMLNVAVLTVVAPMVGAGTNKTKRQINHWRKMSPSLFSKLQQ